MNDEPRVSAARNTFLAVVLSLLVGGVGFVFLIVITGGFFFYVLAVMVGFGLFAYLHYLLWGRSLSQDVRGEAGAEPVEGEPGEWPLDEPPGPQRM
jgi:hypothetical protein